MADPVRREKGRAASRRYYAAHRERVQAAGKRWRSRPQNVMADRLRSRLRQAYQHGLKSSIEQLLGCSLDEFRAHIASLKGKTAEQCRQELQDRLFTFHWIVPEVGTPIKPPF